MAAAANISNSTAFRLLATMRQAGFVDQGLEGDYIPGPQLISLLHALDQWSDIRPAARLATIALRDRLDETSSFFVLSGGERLCIEAAESRRLVRRSCPPGLRAPIHLGAAGKVLIAFGDTESLLGRIETAGDSFALTTGERRTVEELRQECVRVRQEGYAFSRQESTLESWAVATPFWVAGHLAGALSVAVPMTRNESSYIEKVIAEVREGVPA